MGIKKMYRIIEPIKKYETDSVEYNTGKKIETIFHKEHLSQCSKDGEKIFRYGETIVPFSQLEEWIDMGLQPLYFTEEVIENKVIARYLSKYIPDEKWYLNLQRAYDVFEWNHDRADRYKLKAENLEKIISFKSLSDVNKYLPKEVEVYKEKYDSAIEKIEELHTENVKLRIIIEEIQDV